MPKTKKSSVIPLIDCYNSSALTSLSIEQKEEMQALILKSYQLGQEESEKRTAKMMSRIFSAFIGVDAGIDVDGSSKVSTFLKIFSRIKR